MTQYSMDTGYSKRVEDKFQEAQYYLRANGFIWSTKHLLRDIENTFDKKYKKLIIISL